MSLREIFYQGGWAGTKSRWVAECDCCRRRVPAAKIPARWHTAGTAPTTRHICGKCFKRGVEP